MAKIAPQVFWQSLDDNGDPLASGKVYTYEAGTATPKTTYTDEAEGTPNDNPITLDSAGRADIWLDTGSYKFVIKDSADVTVDTVDDITAGASDVYNSAVVALAVNTSVVSSHANQILDCTSTITLSLLDVATATQGFTFVVKNSGSGIITIDPDAAELIDGASTLDIDPDGSVNVTCTGTAWITTNTNYGTDYKAKIAVSSNDTTPADLETKLLVAAGLSLSTQNDGAAETRTITQNPTALTTATVTASDEIMIADVDDSNNPKKDTVQGILDLVPASVTLGTPTASTSGTAISFASIPAGTKRIIVSLIGVSTNGTSDLIVQIGDSGGYEASGYSGTSETIGVASQNMSTGFDLTANMAATYILHGAAILTLENSSAFTWSFVNTLGNSDSAVRHNCAGTKSLSAELDRIQVTTVGGSDTFDAGEINITYD
jgi:hypothetical protein